MQKSSITTAFICVAMALSTSLAAQPFMPPKEVRLGCEPLPYVFDCSISRMPNPQFTSRCFYVADGQSTLMKSDHRMGFANEIVSLKIDAGMSVTGTVTESQSGKQTTCEEE